jgi:ribosomal protein S18 acetylase RimI-like enzyme
MHAISINEVPISHIGELCKISSAFEVKSILDINPDPERQKEWIYTESKLPHTSEKDYDSLIENHPLDWAKQFDMRNWGLLFAFASNELIGSALIAYNTPGVDMLEDKSDQAVLWDIRVAKKWRGMGAGKALFDAVKEWAIIHRCTELKIETQTNNVAAIRFYLRQGCTLKRVIYNSYPELPEEVQVLFYLPLSQGI